MAFQNDKRRFTRINKSFTIAFRNLDQPGAKYDRSVTRNIGIGGALLTTAEEFCHGTTLELVITIPYTLESVTIKGRVSACKKITRIIYETGVQFIDLPLELKKLFLELEREGIHDYASSKYNAKWRR